MKINLCEIITEKFSISITMRMKESFVDCCVKWKRNRFKITTYSEKYNDSGQGCVIEWVIQFVLEVMWFPTPWKWEMLKWCELRDL
jgi:hypothetical protein